MMFFLAQRYRVIAHDRRGHGRLARPRTATISLEPATIGSTQLAEVLNFAPSNASTMKQTLLNHPGDPEDQVGVEALRVALNC